MTRRQSQLALRRRELIARAAAQRAELARRLGPWKPAFAVADRGVEGVRFLRRHPALWAGTLAFLIALRPMRAFTWLRRGWTAWRLVRSARRRWLGE